MGKGMGPGGGSAKAPLSPAAAAAMELRRRLPPAACSPAELCDGPLSEQAAPGWVRAHLVRLAGVTEASTATYRSLGMG